MAASLRTASSSLSAQLVSVAGLIGRPVRTGDGQKVGRVVDLICRNDAQAYPPVAGLVVRVGFRRIFVPGAQVAEISGSAVILASAQIDMHDYQRRSGERLLMGHIVDHQVVDVDGVRVVRVSDLYLARLGSMWCLVGVDVSMTTLLRRLGPAVFRVRPTPDRVIDWAVIQSFGTGEQPVRLASDRAALHRLRPAQLADLLEELGRSQRQELLSRLDPGTAADAVEEMEDDDVRELLRDADEATTVELMVHMEPDEAVDALRDLDHEQREEILASVPEATSTELRQLLAYDEDVAAGIMTSRLITLTGNQTVGDATTLLREYVAENGNDLTYVVVVDEEGRLVDDITVVELLIAGPATPLSDLVGEPWPVTVTADLPIDELAQAFIDNRGSSVLVLDSQRRPLGRVMADDLVDVFATQRRGLLWRKS